MAFSLSQRTLIVPDREIFFLWSRELGSRASMELGSMASMELGRKTFSTLGKASLLAAGARRGFHFLGHRLMTADYSGPSLKRAIATSSIFWAEL